MGAPASSRSVDDLDGGACADAVLVAGGPHQRGQVVAVGALGADAGLEQAAHDERKAARGRVGDRRLAGRIHDVRIGTARESGSTMRPLPLNAAAASGVTPDAPGRFGIGACSQAARATVACRSFSAAP